MLHTFDSDLPEALLASENNVQVDNSGTGLDDHANDSFLTKDGGDSTKNASNKENQTNTEEKMISSSMDHHTEPKNAQNIQNVQDLNQDHTGVTANYGPPFHSSQTVEITDTATNRPIEIIPMNQMRQRSLRKRTIEQLYPYRIELERYKQRFEQAGINVRKKDAPEKHANSNSRSRTGSPVSMGRNATPDRPAKRKSRESGDLQPNEEETTPHPPSTPAFINRRKRIIHDEDSLEREETPAPKVTMKASEPALNFHEDEGPSSPLSETFSSDEYQTSDSEPEKEKELEMLNTLKKRVKGVLPPSFITLEYAKFLNKRKIGKSSPTSKAKEVSNDSNVPHKGLAKRKIGKRTGVGPMGLAPAQINQQLPEAMNLSEELDLSSDGEDDLDPSFRSKHIVNRTFTRADNVLVNSDSDISEDDIIDTMLQTKNRSSAVKGSRKNINRPPYGNSRTPRLTTTPTHKPVKRRDRQTSAKKLQQISLHDVYELHQTTGKSKRPPSFMRIATRTAAVRTRNRSDTPSRKYIHIEDDEGVSAAPRGTIKKWRQGDLKQSRSNETVSKTRKFATVMKGVPNSMKISTGVPRSRVVASTEGDPAQETLRSSSGLSTRFNSKESYLEKRQRQFQTVVLEAPTGRYAVRSGKAAMRNTFEGRLEGLRGPNNLHTKEPVIDIFSRVLDWAANHGQDPVVNQSQDNGKINLLRNTSHERNGHSERKKTKAVRKEIRKQKRKEARRQRRLEAARSMAKFDIESAQKLRTRAPDVERFDCGLRLPSSNLRFSSNTFIGRGFLQTIIEDRSMELNREDLILEIDDITVSLDQPSFVSSVGLSVSLLKKQFHESAANCDANDTPTKLFAALFSVAYRAKKFPHAIDTSNISCLISTLYQLVEDIKGLWAENLSMKSSKQFWNMSIRSYCYSLALLYYLNDFQIQPSDKSISLMGVVQESFSHLLSKIWAMGGLQLFCDEARAHRSALKRVITSKSYLTECLVLSYLLLENIEGSSFLNIITRIAQLSIGKDGLECLETVWMSVFCYSYIKKLISYSSNVSEPTMPATETSCSSWSWKIPKLILCTLEPLFLSDTQQPPKSTSKYFALSIFRCAHLTGYWGWQPDRLFLVSLFDFFARRGFANIEDESSSFELPQLLLDDSFLLQYSEKDTSFTAFLKLTAITLQTYKNQGKQLEITKLNARITPLNGRHYSKMSSLKVSDLEALCNQYAVLLVRVAYCPRNARPSADQLRDMNELNESHILVKKLALSVWKTFVMLLLRDDDDPQKAMDWFDSMLISALTEYDSIEKIEVQKIDGDNDRISENFKKYVEFFEEGITAWIDVTEGPAGQGWPTSMKFWYKLLRKTSIRILQYGVSQNVSKLCLDLLNRFLDKAGFSQKAIECFHEVILQGFYKFVSNVISGDTVLTDHLYLYSIETWVRLAALLARNGVISWDSFLLSRYSWNWFSDTKLRANLQPVWYGGLYSELRSSQEADIFRAQFLRSLTVQDIEYEYRMVEPYLRLNGEKAMSSLKCYCDLVGSAKGLKRYRKDILKGYILYLSDIQINQPQFVRDTLGILLRYVKDTYLKALTQDHSNYFSLAESVVSMIISNIEVPDIPNLSWFRSSNVFKNTISIITDSVNLKRYTKSELDANSEKRFCMFMIYSLELSVMNNHGDAFVKSTASALFESDTALSAKNYLLESFFPEYAYLASRDEFAEALLPTVLRLFCHCAKEIASHRKKIEFKSFKKMLQFVNAYLQESPDGIYSITHPYWSTAALSFDLCSKWIASWHDVGKNVKFDDCDPGFLSELVFRALDVIIKERMEENDLDIQAETDQGHIRESIMKFLENYERIQEDDGWIFKNKHTEDVVNFKAWTSYREAQNSAVGFLMRLFSCGNLPQLVKDEGKSVYEALMMESKSGMPASICEALVSTVPNMAGHIIESSNIDDFII